MMMEVDNPQDALIDAVVGEEGNDIKSISPGTSVRRARPRYKVMCEDMRSRETDERLEKLYPLVDQMKTPLPLRWNHQDRSCYISLSENNRRVTYNGGRSIKDAAAVRAEHPIPMTCGVFYFEVTIAAEGDECCLGVGLCEKTVDLNRLPGWDKFSYGYHGDDGNFFSSSGAGTPYGPTYTANDVIGCGINFVTNSVFFTKNGENLGNAINNVPKMRDLFPMVGIQKNGAISDSNFGQHPFKYDVEKEFKETREYVLSNLKSIPLSANKTGWMDFDYSAICSWLCHEGYGRALGAFKRQAELHLPIDCGLISHIEDESSESLDKRRGYKELIIAGKSEEVIERVKADHPTIFETNKELHLLMKCQLFTEKYAEANHVDISKVIPTVPSSYPATMSKPKPRHVRYPGRDSYAHVFNKDGMSYTVCAPSRSFGTVNPFKRRGDQAEEERQARRVRTAYEECESYVQVPPSCDPMSTDGSSVNEPVDDPMEGRTEEVGSSNGVAHASNGIANISNDIIGNAKPEANGVANSATSATTIVNEEGGSIDSQQDLVGGAERSYTSYPGWTGGNAKDMMSRAHMISLLTLGRQINELLSEIQEPPESLSKRVKDTLALICHTKPLETALRYLLEPSLRAYTATALNSALREEMGYLSESVLTLHCLQARKLRQKLADGKISDAAFLDVDDLITKQLGSH